MLELGQSQPSKGPWQCLCHPWHSLDEPLANAPARSVPPRMLTGSRGRGAASALVKREQARWLPPPQGTGLLGAGKSWRLVPSFQRAEVGWIPMGRAVGHRRGGRSLCWVPVARWLLLSCGFGSGESSPRAWRPMSPAQSGQEVTGNQGNEQGNMITNLNSSENQEGEKKPAVHLTCPDVLSLPIRLPAPAGQSRQGPQR